MSDSQPHVPVSLGAARVATMVVAAALAVALAGCGSGGGGPADGDGSDTPAFAATAATWWASGSGARWTYRLAPAGGEQAVLKTVSDLGDTVVNGRTVRRFEHSRSMFGSGSETEYRYYDGAAVRNLAVSGVEGWTGPQDYAELPAPLREGVEQTVYDATQPYDLDGDAQVDSLRVQVTVTMNQVATLTVPAGDFRNLVAARQQIKVTGTRAGSGLTATATTVLTVWYAPGVGIVRRALEDPSVPLPDNVTTEELVGVVIGSARSGTTPLPALLDGIGFGTSSATPPSLESAAGGGRLMTVAVSESGQVVGSIVDGTGATIWRGTVLQAPADFRFAAARVLFDGTDFRVAALRHITTSSPSRYAVVGQRVGSGGELRDGPEGVVLDTGVPDASQTLSALQMTARNGQVLLVWSRYDTTPVPSPRSLLEPRGYVAEGRLFDVRHQPMAARFEIASGIAPPFSGSLAQAAALREDEYVVLVAVRYPGGSLLQALAVGLNGVPAAGGAKVINSTIGSMNGVRLQAVGSECWASWSEVGIGGTSITVARLGRGGVLLDGTPGSPGRLLVPAGDVRAAGVLTLGATRSTLSWVEGWDTVRVVAFDTGLLAAGAPLPIDFTEVVAAGSDSAYPGPSRVALAGVEFDGGLLVSWLDNQQTSATPSDSVQATLLRPRLVP